jgi:hypothetical protein
MKDKRYSLTHHLYESNSKAQKLTSQRLRRMILKEIIAEQADPTKLDFEKFPLKLSDVDPDEAELHVKLGSEDFDKEVKDDKIAVNSSSIPVSDLKPSQSSMNIDKAVGMAISMINKSGPFKGGPGGNLGAFISKDNYIMDGHHRWIASYMVDPSAKVVGNVVDFPRKQLIAVLNTMTKGAFNVQKGKPATGGFEQFTPAMIEKTLNKFADDGDGQFIKPEDVKKAAESFTGLTGEEAIEAMSEKFADNISGATLSVPTGSPEREDMPVIDSKNIEKAIDLLNTGHVDVSDPYGEKNESINIMRWKKMAGIL